jgi:hypothetical protein
MPKALDYRNFMEFPRLQDEIRFKLFNSLKFDKNSNFLISFCTSCFRSYVDFVTTRADYHTKLLPQDRRNKREKEQANKIWKNARPHGTTKGFVFFKFYLDIYVLFLSDDLALLYLKTVHPDRQKAATRQSVIPLAKQFDLAHLHEALRQEKLNKQLRNDMNRGIALPYFQSEWGMAYTQQETQNVSARGSKSAGTISNSTILIFLLLL